MRNSCKLIGLLTPWQAELLKTLFELEQQTQSRKLWRPKDLGAYRSSHHANTLRKLADQGLVERELLGEPDTDGTASKSFGYRISVDGQATWELMCEMSDIPSHTLMGGAKAGARAWQMSRTVRSAPARPALDLSALFRKLA